MSQSSQWLWGLYRTIIRRQDEGTQRLLIHWQHGPRTPLPDSSGAIALVILVHPCWCLSRWRRGHVSVSVPVPDDTNAAGDWKCAHADSRAISQCPNGQLVWRTETGGSSDTSAQFAWHQFVDGLALRGTWNAVELHVAIENLLHEDTVMSTRRSRASVACEKCRQRKVRCSITLTGVPCISCTQDGSICTVRNTNFNRYVAIIKPQLRIC